MNDPIQAALRALASELARTTQYDDVRRACMAVVEAIDAAEAPKPDAGSLFTRKPKKKT